MSLRNIVFFITHKTLSLELAELSLSSLSKQNDGCVLDKLYIFNTHESELSNDTILGLVDKYNLQRFFKDVVCFPHDVNHITTLAGMVKSIKQYCLEHYNREDRILLLKSDCLLSKNYFQDMVDLPQTDMIYFCAPFICAKKRIPNDEIIEYVARDTFIRSDDITFFVEDQERTTNNDFHNRPHIDLESEQIKFTSCYVIRDFTCHFFSVGLFDRISLVEQSWGGVNFHHLVPFFHETDRSFVVHKFHSVISENRSTDREGPVKAWLES